MKTSYLDVADEEQFFFTPSDNEIESEEQTLQRNKNSRKDANEWAANEQPSSLKSSVKELTKIDANTTPCSMIGIKANAQIRVE